MKLTRSAGERTGRPSQLIAVSADIGMLRKPA
jgi:hypothetical protein